MSKTSLMENLGTIARSGTSEFLEKLEKGNDKSTDGGNLIGQVRRLSNVLLVDWIYRRRNRC